MATLAMATLQEPVSAGPLAPLESSRLLIAEADVSYDRAKVLGQGSFAVVYEGTLLGSTRVAVKVLRSALVDKATSRAFAREVGNWEGLAQRNILPLLAFCISPPMLISEIADGGNLRQYLGRRSWDQPLGLRLLVDVVRGMAYLHSKGILHGDLKSVNVLVDGSRALVCDFGLSRFRHPALGTATETAGPAMGTVGFMAPEMFTGAPLRAPADVYAFGMTCFEVVSGGGMPFGEGVNAMAAMYQVVFEKARPERPQGVQDGMWALMERCWRHEAGDRSTFVEVTSELEALVIPGSSE
ncbi:kinase-like domain-containing protein [Hyaloraphidium curvatum]|nr:kinase-like domain-containing protein [Hyaloraphidium curvatum]